MKAFTQNSMFVMLFLNFEGMNSQADELKTQDVDAVFQNSQLLVMTCRCNIVTILMTFQQ